MHPAPRHDWHTRAFGPLVDVAYAPRDRRQAIVQVEALTRLLADCGRQPRGVGGAPAAMLDAGCGAGRHLAPLARSARLALGIDLRAGRLRAGRRRGVREPLVRADLCRLPLRDGSIDAVHSLFSSFGYLGEAGDRAVLFEWSRVLRPGGSLVLDLADRGATAAHLVPRSTRRVGGLAIRESRRMVGGVTVVKRVRIDRGRDRVASWVERLRLYSLGELEERLGEAGFVDLRRLDSAGLPGFGPRRLLVVARTVGGLEAL